MIELTPREVESFWKNAIPDLPPFRGAEVRTRCRTHPGATRDSFAINTKTGQYMCHSCQIHGDAVTFEQQRSGADPKTAIERVCQIVGRVDTGQYKPRADRGKLVCTYFYRNEQGETISGVDRWNPKRFVQWQQGPNGKRIYNMDGVRRVLYHLPEVTEASTVIVFEGERFGAREELTTPARQKLTTTERVIR